MISNEEHSEFLNTIAFAIAENQLLLTTPPQKKKICYNKQ